MSQINAYQYYESNNTLLSMLSKSESSNALLNQIIEDNNTAFQNKMEEMGVTTSSSSKYQSVEKASTNLLDAISTLQDENTYDSDEDSTNETRAKVVKAVSNFVTAYNSASSSLTSCGGALYNKFSSLLDDDITDNADAFAAIGISFDEKGKMVLDTDKLNAASVSDIQELFSKSSGKLSNLSSTLSSIDEIVDTALSYSSSTYTSSGTYSI